MWFDSALWRRYLELDDTREEAARRTVTSFLSAMLPEVAGRMEQIMYSEMYSSRDRDSQRFRDAHDLMIHISIHLLNWRGDVYKTSQDWRAWLRSIEARCVELIGAYGGGGGSTPTNSLSLERWSYR
ncbi:unnamed protein product [Prorocentrum cordatum]|uniref:Uncharacterized protein n=1 Tax=Prorocentrum cordatum TaxID=2364126 RepID=A0ABN9UW17_9DINO|nr:unnamed protein product [Polarella glacialis]